jgi:DNA-binding protein Fis
MCFLCIVCNKNIVIVIENNYKDAAHNLGYNVATLKKKYKMNS